MHILSQTHKIKFKYRISVIGVPIYIYIQAHR